MLFRASLHFYKKKKILWRKSSSCVNALSSFTSFLHISDVIEKDTEKKTCQCSFELHFISTLKKPRNLSQTFMVSMLFRASLHFYQNCCNTFDGYHSLVSMLFRASLHFYPYHSEALDLQGFLRPVLQVFFRIFWKIAFFGVFLCLSDFFHVFHAVLVIFQFLLESWFSPFFVLFPSSIIIISPLDNVKRRLPNNLTVVPCWLHYTHIVRYPSLFYKWAVRKMTRPAGSAVDDFTGTW